MLKCYSAARTGSDDLIDIKDLQALVADRRNVEVSAYAILRLKERKIKLTDIYKGIEGGNIIEQYPWENDFMTRKEKTK